MLHKKIKYIVATSFILFIFFGAIISAQTTSTTQDLSAHVTNQALVKLVDSDKIYKINSPEKNISKLIKANQSNSAIEYIEPNYLYTATIEANDPYFSQQLYLSSINAPQAWNYTTGNNSVVIAIIDSGVAIDNPDLKNNLWYNLKEIPGNNIDDDNNGYIDDYNGWDFITNTHDPRPKFSESYSFLGMNHGTIIAGVAAAKGNNGEGISGVIWNAKIMSLRVLDSSGTGNTLDVAKAVDYAVDNGADIINLSFVGSGKSTTLEHAIARANSAGVIIVAAAGNEINQGIDMTEDPKYPVCHDGGFGNNWVIGVASIDNNNKLASFSNYGGCVDIVAPGVSIFSTLYKDASNPKFARDYGGYWSGTSVSSPQVVGALALIKSLKPSLSAAEVIKVLLDSTDSIDYRNQVYTGKLGSGKLNIVKAVTQALNTIGKTESTIDKLIVGPGVGGGPHVRTYQKGKLFSQFFAFDKNKRYGVNVASRDINADGREELIVSANTGEEPWVKIFNIHGTLQNKFLAFDKTMKQGIATQVGDIDNDGQMEIVVVAQKNYRPTIKIFNISGQLESEFDAFNPFFKGGLNLSIGDVNNDGFEEIIVGTGPGASPTVKIFNYSGQLLNQFIAYDPNFLKGITVTNGDVDGDGLKEIITSTRFGGGPQVRVFDITGRVKSQFFAYSTKFTGGVNVAAGDIDGNGIDEIITGAGPGGGPHVRVFDSTGQVKAQFFAYSPNFTGGVFVSSSK